MLVNVAFMFFEITIMYIDEITQKPKRLYTNDDLPGFDNRSGNCLRLPAR